MTVAKDNLDKEEILTNRIEEQPNITTSAEKEFITK